MTIETLKAEIAKLAKAEKKASKAYYKLSNLHNCLQDARRYYIEKGWNCDTPEAAWKRAISGRIESFGKQINKKTSPWHDRHIPTDAEIAKVKSEADKLYEIYIAAMHATSQKRSDLSGKKKAATKTARIERAKAAGKRTCPCCFRVHEVVQNVITRHGWTEHGGRKVGEYGRAWHSRECFGTDHLPYEVSCEGTKAYHQRLAAQYNKYIERRNRTEEETRYMNSLGDALDFLEEKINAWKPVKNHTPNKKETAQ